MSPRGGVRSCGDQGDCQPAESALSGRAPGAAKGAARAAVDTQIGTGQWPSLWAIRFVTPNPSLCDLKIVAVIDRERMQQLCSAHLALHSGMIVFHCGCGRAGPAARAGHGRLPAPHSRRGEHPSVLRAGRLRVGSTGFGARLRPRRHTSWEAWSGPSPSSRGRDGLGAALTGTPVPSGLAHVDSPHSDTSAGPPPGRRGRTVGSKCV